MEDDRNQNNRKYTNGEITVYWRPNKCIHATTCYRELIEVFNPRKRPWVDMEGASTEEIIRVVDLCPTRALTYKWNKDIDPETETENAPVSDKDEITPDDIVQESAEIRVMKDGPLLVKGNFKIIDADGIERKKMKIASFCRCGRSGNMPFCDGSHRKIGFDSD